MRSLGHFAALVVLLAAGCAAAKPKPKPDRAAIRDAVRAHGELEGRYASAAAYAHFLRARLYHHGGQHRRALDELRLALATDEGSPWLLTRIGEEYARLGELGRAERALQAALQSDGAHAPAHLMLARVLAETHRLAQARTHVRRAIRLSPQEEDGYLLWAQVELEAGRPDAALGAVDALAKAVPRASRGLRILGTALSDRGDHPRAEQALRRAVDANPADQEAWIALAQLLERSARPAEAETALGSALLRDPDNIDVLLAAGRLALQQGAPHRTRAYFDRLLSLTDEPEKVVKVAFAYLASGRLQEATEVLDQVRHRPFAEPRLAFYAALIHEKLRRYGPAAEAYGAVPEGTELYEEARLRQAIALSLAGDHARALSSFRRAVARNPGQLPVYPAYARALERTGAYASAEAVLRGALERGFHHDLYDALARNLQRQGKDGQALSLLEAVAHERPADGRLMFILGAAYERSGEVDKCLAKMRAVLAVDPENAAALNFIGYTLADAGRDYDEAERLLVRALELRPETGAFLDSLGWVYFRRGDYRRAVDLLERAQALEPDEPVILEHLGDAYRALARDQDAARAYHSALEVLGRVDDPLEVRGVRSSLERKLKELSSETAGR
jgi:tetratricopeptide (TPR) repeat protein